MLVEHFIDYILMSNFTNKMDIYNKNICTNDEPDCTLYNTDPDINTFDDLDADDTGANKMNYYAKKRINLYKTEMCRSFEETGICKYSDRCQFAHSRTEIRKIDRHPRYKTETCRTFWEDGTCPYGKRCCFIHLERNSAKKDTKKEIYPEIESRTIEHTEESSEIIFNEICVSEIPQKDIQSEIGIVSSQKSEKSPRFNFKSLFLKSEESLFNPEDGWNQNARDNSIYEARPFWCTNEALKWAPKENIFCFVTSRNHRYHRTTHQPKAPGEPMNVCQDSETIDFLFEKLGL